MNERGAMMLEGVIALVFLLFITIGVVDFSLVFYRFSELNAATGDYARDIATDLSLPQDDDCDTIEASLNTSYTIAPQEAFHHQQSSVTLTLEQEEGAPYPVVRVMATTDIVCVYCHLLFDGTIDITARSVVENTELDCTAASADEGDGSDAVSAPGGGGYGY